MGTNLLESMISYGIQYVDIDTPAVDLGLYIGPFDGGQDVPEYEQKIKKNFAIGHGPDAQSINPGMWEVGMTNLSYLLTDFNFAANAWGHVKIITGHAAKTTDSAEALSAGDTEFDVVSGAGLLDKYIQIGTDADPDSEVVYVSNVATNTLTVTPAVRHAHLTGVDIFISTDDVFTSTITSDTPRPLTVEYPVIDEAGVSTFVRQAVGVYVREFEVRAQRGDFNPKVTCGVQALNVDKTLVYNEPTPTTEYPYNTDGASCTLTAWDQLIGELISWKIRKVRQGKTEGYMSDTNPELPKRNKIGFNSYELEAALLVEDDTYIDMLVADETEWTLTLTRSVNDYIKFTTTNAILGKKSAPYPDDAMLLHCTLSGECRTMTVEIKGTTLIP